MTRRTASALCALSLLALGLAGCSSSSQEAGQEGKQESPGATFAVGELVPPGGPVEVQELPDACDTAVAGLRGLMGRYRNGYQIDPAASAELNEGLGQARQGCTPEDFQRFYDRELNGWLSPAPGSPLLD